MIRTKIPGAPAPVEPRPAKTMSGHSAINPVTPRMEAARTQVRASEHHSDVARSRATATQQLHEVLFPSS